MQHAAENARELPKSVAGEFETLLPQLQRAPRHRSTHADRATLVLSDNPRWIAGSPQAALKHQAATALREKFPDAVHLYNRRLLNGRAESMIDILTVASTGVWLVEVDDASGGKIELAGRMSGWRSPHEQFLVDGEDYTAVIQTIDRKAAQVRQVLAEAGWRNVFVQSVLCLVGAKLLKHGRVAGTEVSSLAHLHKVVKTGPMKLDVTDLASLGLACGERFRRPRREL